MKRILFLLLSLSMGLNAGLLYVRYVEQPSPGPFPGPPGQQRLHRPPPPPEVMIEHQLAAKTRHLGLDSVQQEAILEIMEKHIPAISMLKEKARTANHRMTQVYARDPFDMMEFQRLMKEASRARAEADSLSALILAEEASILTAEQRRLFAEVAPMAQMEGHRPPPPPRVRH